MRDSLNDWNGSDKDKDDAADYVVNDLVRVVESSAPNEKRIRKDLNEKGIGIAQVLKTNVGEVKDLLVHGNLNVDEMFNSSVEYTKHNREVFDNITDRHKQLVSLVENEGRSWEEAVVADASSIEAYAKAATAMGAKPWVKLGHQWMESTALDFFQNGGAKKFYLKNMRAQFFSQYGRTMTESEAAGLDLSDNLKAYSAGENRRKIKVLDVGSCYNPFIGKVEFDVTALDLCPTHASVYKCDFLAVDVGPADSHPVASPIDPSHSQDISVLNKSSMVLQQLPCDSYDVVLMSLVLSYLPSPAHRRQMIEKARRLLTPVAASSIGHNTHPHKAGMLLIVEKESILHSGSKSEKFLRHWKASIQELGFELYRYNLLSADRRKAHTFAFIRAPEHSVLTSGAGDLWVKADLDALPAAESAAAFDRIAAGPSK